MCLIAFAINASVRWPLVIASNRDESFVRPTLPLKRWISPQGGTIFSGQDVRGGGTWLGFGKTGRAAFLTNVRQGSASADPAPRSRGELVVNWLETDASAAEFRSRIKPEEYGGFNLVVGDWTRQSWTWLSNRHGAGETPDPAWEFRNLAPGVYGLSNAALDTPWPKTLALKAALGAALAGQAVADVEMPLWEALENREEAAEASLPSTGVSMEMEKALSSAFVYAPARAYGTRCSTLVIGERKPLGEPHLHLKITERTFEPGELPGLGHQVKRQTLDWPG